jgi:hypothetical protein
MCEWQIINTIVNSDTSLIMRRMKQLFSFLRIHSTWLRKMPNFKTSAVMKLRTLNLSNSKKDTQYNEEM